MVLEILLGHTFTCKSLLLESITHPSHLSIHNTPSYRRLEYLGDALLNYLVTTTIFSHEDPSKVALQLHHMHTLAPQPRFLRSDLSHVLSQLLLQKLHHQIPTKHHHLFPLRDRYPYPNVFDIRPILALASVLSATRTRFAALEPIINTALSHGLVYLWRAFAAFAPEKVFSDMIEAVLGAVYIDTAGDLRACDALLRRFGITDWVETTLKKEVQIRHSKEEVGSLAMNEKVRYRVWIEHDDYITSSSGDLVSAGKEKLDLRNGRNRCKFIFGEREICSARGWNRIDVKTAAAGRKLRILV